MGKHVAEQMTIRSTGKELAARDAARVTMRMQPMWATVDRWFAEMKRGRHATNKIRGSHLYMEARNALG